MVVSSADSCLDGILEKAPNLGSEVLNMGGRLALLLLSRETRLECSPE